MSKTIQNWLQALLAVSGGFYKGCIDHGSARGPVHREGAVNDASQLYQEALDCQVDEIQRAQIISKLSRVLAITDPMAVVALESELQPMREFSVSDIDQLEGSTKGMRRKDEGLKKRPATDGTDKVFGKSFMFVGQHTNPQPRTSKESSWVT